MSNVQVTFELYGDFYKTTFTKYCLTLRILKLSGSFEIHWVRLHLVIVKGLASMINTNIYKTEQIIPGLGHGKVSYLLTLIPESWKNSTSG